jgi:glycosyltransferase involved in cell wall biosynthesis
MKKKLSIIIPCYNEERTIVDILSNLTKIEKYDHDLEIIVIDDYSSDNSLFLIEKNNTLFTHLIKNSKNNGKGFCVREGLKKATGDYIIFQDADLEYDVNDISRFIKMINKFSPDMILGSRFNYFEYTRSHNFLNKCGNYIITTLLNVLYNTTFSDIYTCYVCFRRQLINPQELLTNGWEQQAEIICKVIKKSKMFFEIPINYNGRTAEEGKKIKYYHIFYVIFTIFKERLKK